MIEKLTKKNQRNLIVVVYILGFVVGMLFNGVVVWANIEASLWEVPPTDDEPLIGFVCPKIITKNEIGQVRFEIPNTLNRPINPVVRTKITQGFVSFLREENERPDIEPGETARLTYDVTADDAAWDRFVLVRVYTLPQYSLPSRSGSCGIVALNIPFLSGSVVLGLILTITLTGLGGGLWLWRKVNSPTDNGTARAHRVMILFAALVLVGILLNLLGVNGLASLVLLFTFVVMVALIGYYLATA